MNRIILSSCLSLFIFFSIFLNHSFANGGEKILDLSYEGIWDFEKDKDHYHSIAEAFGIYLLGEDTRTHIVTYNRTQSGFLCHVGWYGDGYIITILNGIYKGKQIIVYQDDFVSVAYPDRTDTGFFYRYPWGIVSTKQHEQDISIHNSVLWSQVREGAIKGSITVTSNEIQKNIKAELDFIADVK